MQLTGSLMSLFLMASLLVITTRIKLPEPAERRSNCFTVGAPAEAVMATAGRLVI